MHLFRIFSHILNFLFAEVARTCDDKKRVLDNQISIIQEEKMKIEKEIQVISFFHSSFCKCFLLANQSEL